MNLVITTIDPPEPFVPCKQHGLEQSTILRLRVEIPNNEIMRSYAEGAHASERTIQAAMTMLEQGALVAVDKWMESGAASAVGLSWYLVEPSLTDSQTERHDPTEPYKLEIHSSVRAVRGLMRFNAHLPRSLEAQGFTLINRGRNGSKR